MVEVILEIINKPFCYFFNVFSYLPSNISLFLISAISGVFLVKLFGIFSNQRKIGHIKDKITACMLGIVLYKDDIGVCIKLQAKMFEANLLYIANVLMPSLVIMSFLLPILGQLNIRFGYQSLCPGDKVNVSIEVEDGALLNDVSIVVDDGLKVLSPALRIKAEKEIDWKLQTNKNGVHDIRLLVNKKTYAKTVSVGISNNKLSPIRAKGIFLNLLYPGERLFPKDSEIKSIKISYPVAYVRLFSYEFHWLLVFCIISILSGLVFKKVLKVSI